MKKIEINQNNKKDEYYYGNIHPLKCFNYKKNSIVCPLYEVENFLCTINKIVKYVKLIKYLK